MDNVFPVKPSDGVPLFSTSHPRPYWVYKPTRDGRSPWRNITLSEASLTESMIVYREAFHDCAFFGTGMTRTEFDPASGRVIVSKVDP